MKPRSCSSPRRRDCCLKALTALLLALFGVLSCHDGATDNSGRGPTADAPLSPAPAASTSPGSPQPATEPLDAAAPPAPSTAVAAPTPSAATEPSKPVVYIQPLGARLPDDTVQFVRTSLLAFYDFDVQVLERVELPDWALNRTRSRYRAEKLLTLLEQRLPKGGFRILGLTGSDISTTKGQYADWGILGLATIDGRVCVISSFRTKRQVRSTAHAQIRLGKTAVHEIGHTLGLRHCPNRGCLMEDARGTVLTTDREYDLCSDCRRRLTQLGYRLVGDEVPIPWPKP